jgi:hypothetical protein
MEAKVSKTMINYEKERQLAPVNPNLFRQTSFRHPLGGQS